MVTMTRRLLLVFLLWLVQAKADITTCYTNFTELTSLGYPNSIEMILYSGKSLFDAGDFYGCKLLDTATYCVVDFTLEQATNSSVSLTTSTLATWIGLCVPASCNSTDVTELGSQLLEYYLQQHPGIINLTDFQAHCGTYDAGAMTPGAVVATTVVCFLGAMLVLGTLLDFYMEATGRLPFIRPRAPKAINADHVKQGTPLTSAEADAEPLIRNRSESTSRYPNNWTKTLVSCFLAFSLKKNFWKIFTPPVEKTLVAFNGLRALSMAWVIFGHTGLFMTETTNVSNVEWVAEVLKRFSFQFMQAAEFSVDSFFFMSGFLNSYITLNYLFKRAKEISKKLYPEDHGEEGQGTPQGRVRTIKYYGTRSWWALYYFHRVWRLTPVYAFMIMFYTLISPYISSGPFWYRYIGDEGELAKCHTYWWTNLLYINNLYPNYDSQCYSWGWYLANDMQFYAVTPFILLAYVYNRLLGWVVVTLLWGLSITANVLIAWHYNLTESVYGNSTDMYTYWYGRPWTRIAPYLIGIAMAFLIVEIRRKKGDKYHLGAAASLIGYIITAGLIMSSMYGTYTLYHYDDGVWSTTENILYMGLAKSGFTLGVAFIIFTSILGGKYGGNFLRAVLGNNLFTYMARLTYCAYLVHPVLIFVLDMSWEKAFYYSDLMFTQAFTANLVLAFTGGLVVSMLVEAPSINIEKILFPSRH